MKTVSNATKLPTKVIRYLARHRQSHERPANQAKHRANCSPFITQPGPLNGLENTQKKRHPASPSEEPERQNHFWPENPKPIAGRLETVPMPQTGQGKQRNHMGHDAQQAFCAHGCPLLLDAKVSTHFALLHKLVPHPALGAGILNPAIARRLLSR